MYELDSRIQDDRERTAEKDDGGRPASAGGGRSLIGTVVAAARDANIWTIQTNVFPENAASLALHESVGFRVVGRREPFAGVGGVWRDTLFLGLRLP